MAGEQPKKITGGAFGRYMNDHRAELLKECAGKSATASIKLGSERFKSLNANDKVKYEKMYEVAKQKYENDLAAFLAAGGEVKAIKSKKEKKVKDSNKPKKPAGGAYGCYVATNRAELTKACAGKPVTAVSKLAGERWKALSAAEKGPFELQYQAKKAQYEKEMKDYVPPPAANDDVADGDEEDEDGDEDGDEESEKEADAPKKRKADAAVDAQAAKKGKNASSPTDVEAEAKKLGYLLKFKAMKENPKVKSSPSEILDMLQKHKGNVIAAKKSLLGA